MRTTIDLPEPLLRRAKAHAALRGMSLKDLVTEAVASTLGEARPGAPAEATAGALELGKGCTFPLIRGECGPALRNLTPEKVHRLLEEDEVEDAVLPRRRQRMARHRR